MYVDTGGESPASAQSITVTPGELLGLKRAFEDQRDQIRGWLRRNSRALTVVPPPGNDACSRDTADLFAVNGQSAIDAANAFLDQLRGVAEKLGENARRYGLVEEDQVSEFSWRQG